MKQRLIDSFNKNVLEIVKVYLQTFNDRDYFDIRVWYSNDPQSPGAERPTRKGLTLSVELLPELIRALQKAQAEIEVESKEEEGDVV